MKNPVSRFAYATSDIKMPRTKFPRDFTHKTTFSSGTLIPLMWDEVLPGDTFQVDLSSLVRMSTPIHPVMDDAYMDFYFFFVPNRIIWDHWKEFMGESPSDPYLNPIEYTVPQLTCRTIEGEPGLNIGMIPPKSILDYLGVPSNTTPESFSSLPVRAYCKIWNEWFRDENLQHAIDVPTDDQDYNYAYHGSAVGEGSQFWSENREGLTDYIINCARGGDLAPVNKYHDYFTSALIAPQKGDPVAIPLNGFAPVYAAESFSASGLGIDGSNMMVNTFVPGADIGGMEEVKSDGDFLSISTGMLNAKPDNLVANLSFTKEASQAAGVPYASVNDLRYALQLQHLLQNDARFGTRYRELIKGHFMVDAPEGELQVPEFLGGKRVAISMSQVLQTSATDDVTPQGNTAAYSLTTDKFSSFTKSFTEHGILMCVGCVRTKHTYQQGLNKMFSRHTRYDYYFPELDNIPDQPIYNREIFLPNGEQDNNDYVEQFALAKEIFGYQEAFAEYKYHPNMTSGELRSTYPQSLDIWHYGDDYAEQPYLSSEWIRETRKNIDRTLAVSSDLADQFIGDFYFKTYATRCMSMYSNGLGRTL